MSQSLVVSESGAGKTETNKHLLSYLAWRAQVRMQARPAAAELRVPLGWRTQCYRSARCWRALG